MTMDKIFSKKTARVMAFIPGLHIFYCLLSLLMVPCRRKIAYVGMGVVAVTCVVLFRFFPLYGYWIAYVGWTATVFSEYYIGDVPAKSRCQTFKEITPFAWFMLFVSVGLLFATSLVPKIGMLRSSGQEILNALSTGDEESWKSYLYPDYEKVYLDGTYAEDENMCDDSLKDLTSFKRYLRQEGVSVSGTWELRREIGIQYSGGNFKDHYLQLTFPAFRGEKGYWVVACYYWTREKAGIIRFLVQPAA